MCLVARAGPCDVESLSTQEDDHAALSWKALCTTVTGQPGWTHRQICRHANRWKCPVVMVSIPLARRHGRRVSVASSVDRQSKAGVNFRHTTRRCLRTTYDLRLAGNDHAGGNPPCPRARSVQCRRFRARMRGRRTLLPSHLADACRRRCAIGHSGIGRERCPTLCSRFSCAPS